MSSFVSCAVEQTPAEKKRAHTHRPFRWFKKTVKKSIKSFRVANSSTIPRSDVGQDVTLGAKVQLGANALSAIHKNETQGFSESSSFDNQKIARESESSSGSSDNLSKEPANTQFDGNASAENTSLNAKAQTALLRQFGPFKNERPSVRRWFAETALHFLDPDSWNPRPSARKCITGNIAYYRLQSSTIWSSFREQPEYSYQSFELGSEMDVSDDTSLVTHSQKSIHSGSKGNSSIAYNSWEPKSPPATFSSQPKYPLMPSDATYNPWVSEDNLDEISGTSKTTEKSVLEDETSLFSRKQSAIENEIVGWFSEAEPQSHFELIESFSQTEEEISFWFRPIVKDTVTSSRARSMKAFECKKLRPSTGPVSAETSPLESSTRKLVRREIMKSERRKVSEKLWPAPPLPKRETPSENSLLQQKHSRGVPERFDLADEDKENAFYPALGSPRKALPNVEYLGRNQAQNTRARPKAFSASRMNRIPIMGELVRGVQNGYW